MTATHTPGPWRWEINLKSKVLHLVGGQPRQYDLTIMDFDRWGMGRAVATLRDTAHDGMNIMHRLCDRMDWIEEFPGRGHHFDWCASVNHPDMRLMAAAPDLLDALEEARNGLLWYRDAFPSADSQADDEAMARIDAAIAKAVQS